MGLLGSWQNLLLPYLSHNSSMFITLWDLKEPTHYSERAGHGIPGVVVLSSVVYHGWEGKCLDILVTPRYSENASVKKDMI